MKKFTSNKWFYRVIALFFTLLLFFNANLKQISQAQENTTTQENEVTLKNIPITIKYDDSTYFVTGYEETATVKLTSANKVLLDKESNEQTRNFEITADLSDLKTGTYEVPLKIKNLSNAITAVLDPESIHATIEKKVTKNFKVTPEFDESMLAEGYSIDSLTSDPKEISLSTGKSILKQVDSVVAVIDKQSNVSADFTGSAALQALDADGNVLDVDFVPDSVDVSVKILAPSKKVALAAVQTGTVQSGIDHFNFTLATKEIEVSGQQSLLSSIDTVEVPVNVTDIKETTTKSFKPSLPDGVHSTPASISVKIVPVYSTSTNETSQSNAGEVTANQSATTQTTVSTSASSTTQETTTSQ